VCEYSDVAFMSASTTHLSKLDRVQKLAGRLCGFVFPALVPLLLLDFSVNFWIFMDVGCCNYFVQLLLLLQLIHINLTNDSLLFSSSIQFNSFRRSFNCAIPDIWAAIPVELRMRGTVVNCYETFKEICVKCHYIYI